MLHNSPVKNTQDQIVSLYIKAAFSVNIELTAFGITATKTGHTPIRKH